MQKAKFLLKKDNTTENITCGMFNNFIKVS
uniref:Uncharacterized protein n=1 Tax=Anguilla anguilla TaxID=7936 RepID=A0A0E9PKT5_ANGAN